MYTYRGTRKGADVVRKLNTPSMKSKLERSEMALRSKLLLPDYAKCETIASAMLDWMNGKRCESWACTSVNPACYEVHLPLPP